MVVNGKSGFSTILRYTAIFPTRKQAEWVLPTSAETRRTRIPAESARRHTLLSNPHPVWSALTPHHAATCQSCGTDIMK